MAAVEDNMKLWHQRLGHIGFTTTEGSKCCNWHTTWIGKECKNVLRNMQVYHQEKEVEENGRSFVWFTVTHPKLLQHPLNVSPLLHPQYFSFIISCDF